MVAIMLIDYMLNETEQNDKKLVFIAENRILVNQQAEHIRSTLKYLETERLEQQDSKSIDNISKNIDGMVACYVGDSGLLNKLRSNKELKKKKVIVTTAAFLQNLLTHNIIEMESISLLIIDECHHCGDGDHPYKVIMTQYYHTIKQVEKRPKIFGMTASAIRSLNETKANLQKQKLEAYLDCKLTTISSEDELYSELREHTNLPNEIILTYESTNSESTKIDDLKDFCTLIVENLTKFSTIQTKDIIEISRILFNDFNYILDNLGSSCLKDYLTIIFDHIEERKQENQSLSTSELVSFSSDSSYQQLKKNQEFEIIVSESVRNKLTNKIEKIFPKPSPSRKLKLLEEVLNEHFPENNTTNQMRCIVFCERRHTAILLSRYFAKKGLPCDFIIGHNALSVRTKLGFKKNTGFEQKSKTERFRSGELKCLFCTNVVEEGFDVPACNLVIRFDKFTDFLRAYIQSRGRARKQESKFIMMVNSTDLTQQELCKNGKRLQEKMLTQISDDTPNNSEIEDILIYETPSKAKLTLNNSIRLYNQYCAVFPNQSIDEKKPKFSIYADGPFFVTEITFPTNCPVPVFSISNNHEDDPAQYRLNKLVSKRYCAFKAVQLLHKYKELDDSLFPRYSKYVFASTEAEFASPASMATLLPQMPEIFNWREKKLNSIQTDNPSHCVYIYDIFLDNNATDFQFIIPNEIDSDLEELGLLNFRMNGGRHITIKKMESTTVDNDYILKCFEYHEFMFNKVAKISFPDQKQRNLQDWTFFIIPKQAQQHFIDVPVLDIIQHHGKEAENILKNMILETIYNHRVYLLQNIEFDKNPKSHFDTEDFPDYKTYYKEKWGLEIERPQQPLLRAYQPRFSTLGSTQVEHQNIFLVPEFLTACSFTIEMLRFLKLAPEFLYRYYNRLITSIFSKQFELFQPIVDATLLEDGKTLEAFELLEEALTAKRSQVGANYEKLEFFGDSILKYIVSKHIYHEFPLYSSGSLSQLQHKFVSNYFLASVARNTRLPLFIITEPLNTSQLVQNIGGFKSNKFADETNIEAEYKVLADVVESIIGFCYHIFGGSLEQINRFLGLVGVSLPKGEISGSEDIFMNQKLLLRNHFEKLKIDLYKLTEKLNFQFENSGLLLEAFIHPSYNGVFNYERLEFLGDSVLGLIVTSKIFEKFHKNSSFSLGMMSKLREKIVMNKNFANLCIENQLQNYIIFSGNHIAQQVVHSKDDGEYVKMLSDVFESLAGALFVDSHYDLDTVKLIYDEFLWKNFMDEIFTEAENEVSMNSNVTEIVGNPNNPIVTFISTNITRDSSSVLNELLQQFVFNRLDKSEKWYMEESKKPNPPFNMVADFSITIFEKTFTGRGPSIKLAKKQASAECLQYLLEKSEAFLEDLEKEISKK
ncbi:hypothetical protein NAEGRDRAFT_62031 [Naegleria gruberi]|uniref:Uncharacterized protein n=1 Tax=Naegleria gruberi TaxID=5762 RepID=D2UZR2_NAEGR|nr:uncharacterized protein NAEGRDRAFT_62031 [Naegleria gruberi]EFC50206.1 hypothetical protein NAEGRDRAFT_62031 [Naegleria gruberi]|eukprot:XP_002682950.1 hypothetical protein NAEGRDRAFT_62031 [Naegleria gruberi strain NEG-M]